MSDFAKTVHEFTVEAKNNADVIFRASVDELFDKVTLGKQSGGNLPQDTGNLGRSAAVSKVAMPQVDTEPKEYTGGGQGGFIATANAEDTIYIGFQAAYAPRMEFGFVGTDSLGRTYNQAGNHFVSKGAAEWPQIVKEMEAKLGQ